MGLQRERRREEGSAAKGNMIELKGEQWRAKQGSDVEPVALAGFVIKSLRCKRASRAQKSSRLRLPAGAAELVMPRPLPTTPTFAPGLSGTANMLPLPALLSTPALRLLPLPPMKFFQSFACFVASTSFFSNLHCAPAPCFSPPRLDTRRSAEPGKRAS